MSWMFMTIYMALAMLISVAIAVGVFLLVLNRRLTPDLLAFFVMAVGTAMVFVFVKRDLTVDQGLAMSMSSNGWSGRVINPLCLAMCLVALIQIVTRRIWVTAGQAALVAATLVYYIACFIVPVSFDNPSYYGHALAYPVVALTLLLAPSPYDTATTAKWISRFCSFPAALSLVLLTVNYKSVVQLPYVSILPFFEGRLHGASLHANVLGAICAFAILVTAAYDRQSRTERAVLVLVNLAALILTQSKTSWLITLAALLVLGVTRIRFTAALQRPAVILVLLGGMTVAAAYLSMGSSSAYNALADNKTVRDLGTLTGRLDIWRASMYLINQHPLRGPGWGNWVDFITALYPTYVPMPHNLYLTTAIQAGVVGLASLALFLSTLTVLSAQLKRRDRLFAFAFLTMLTLHGISESYTFQIAFTTPTFWLLLMGLRMLSLALRRPEADRLQHDGVHPAGLTVQ